MITYAIDCRSEGEARLAQQIAFKKGYLWSGGTGGVISLKNRRILLYSGGYMLHGEVGQVYGSQPIKTLNLSELNKLKDRS